MKKLFKIFLVVLFIKACLAVAVLFYIDNLIKKGVEHIAANITKTEVALDKVSISFLKSRITLPGFKIANPAGFKEPYFLTSKKVVIKINYKTIFDRVMNITQLALVEPKFYYESNEQGAYNVEVINDNVQNSAKIKDAETRAMKKFIINEIVIGKGKVYSNGEHKKEIDYPGHTLADVGADKGGINADDVVAVMMTAVSNDFQVLGFKNWLHNLIDNFFDKTVPALKENIHNAIQGVKK